MKVLVDRMPRLAVFLCLFLFGCADKQVYRSICDMGPGFRGWEGADVRLRGLLMAGDHHLGPMIVDMRCSRGIQIAWPSSFASLDKKIEEPGRFNKQATVTGKIFVGPGDRRWLFPLKVEDVTIAPPETAAEADRSFDRMVRTRNRYYHSR